MGNCKMVHYVGKVETTLTCDYVRENLDRLKYDFRKQNHTDFILTKGLKDSAYDNFCQSLDTFIDKCKCIPEINMDCKRCPQEDWEGVFYIDGKEGHFCRCESRNLLMAKLARHDKYHRDKINMDNLKKTLHDDLREKLDIINTMERKEASGIVTEVLKYIMDNMSTKS